MEMFLGECLTMFIRAHPSNQAWKWRLRPRTY
ncbi:unnamed protein product [Brugia timori]|uniref:Uncharacterized protein n=1 Tax=Brugia timori TaxID=42155 RepID=A0A0R3QDG3_9BILA|nr:unnamed protein product [Brugia timori]